MTLLNLLAKPARRLPPNRSKVRVGRLITAIVDRLGVDPVCVARLNDGSIMELDPRSRTEAGTFWNGEYEPAYVRILNRLLDIYGPVAYDVGANIGMVGVPMARHLAGTGGVFLFEPVPPNVARLRRNVSLNDLSNCTVYATALGAEPGALRIQLEDTWHATSGNAIALNADETGGAPGVFSVDVARLDDIVARDGLPDPSVIKLDVEGAEVAFLDGAVETIRRARPIILGEFNSELMPKFGTEFPDAAERLPPGYIIFSFVSETKLEAKKPAVGLGDVLLVPEEKLADLPMELI